MTVDKATVTKVARLARLRLDEAEQDRYATKINGIMQWIEQLGEVNTDGVEPLASVTDVTLPLRRDAVTDGNIQDQILKNAPESTSGFFAVPKIVE
ncbi:MAG TPA: Asp-tRNA(Asn)/Glu-tRNA(Gln) amidotransferase subunit GatC [Alphaproteobacteria bacterium]